MAADTFSNTLGYLQMQTGNDNNSWGTQANNAVFQIFEDAIVNTLTSAVTGGALDLSTNAPPIAASQVRFAALIFTGALTLNQTLYVPNIQKFWWVNNQTSGAFTLNIQTKNGSSVIGSGSLLTLGTLTGGSGYTNGTYYNVPLTGGSGSGGIATVVVSGGAVASVTITSRGKQYLSVDTLSAAASSIGGTGSGFSINVATVGNVIPQNSGWQLVICDGSGNIIITPFNSNQIEAPDGALSAPAYSFANETNTGIRRAGFNDMRLTIGGVDVLQITGAGAQVPFQLNLLAGLSSSIIPSGMELAYAGPSIPNGFLFEFGQNNISRTQFPNLLAALRIAFTGSFSNGNATISGIATNLTNLGLETATLESPTPGITNLTISSITATTITMSGNATANSGGSVTIYAYPWGNGDGATTFALPDRRGRVLAGRDNEGGTAIGRLTVGGSGVNGISLAGSGGAQTVTISQAQLPAVNFNINAGSLAGTNGLGVAVNVSGGVVIGGGQGAHQHPIPAATGINVAFGGNPYGNNYTSYGSLDGVATLPQMTGSFSGSGSGNVQGNAGLSGSCASGGSGTAVNNVQPTGMTNWIIKT